MERVHKEVLKPSEKPSRYITFAAKMMAQTAAYYPQQEISKETASVWLEDWQMLISQYGIDEFGSALRAARLGSKFFPSPSEIKEKLKSKIIYSEPEGAND